VVCDGIGIRRLMCAMCDSTGIQHYTRRHAMDTPESHVFCSTLAHRSTYRMRLVTRLYLYTSSKER